jgi:hypothetical protein
MQEVGRGLRLCAAASLGLMTPETRWEDESEQNKALAAE